MKLDLTADDLAPIVQAVTDEVIRRRAEMENTLGDRLAYREAEAAALLGLRQHQLGDARRRGEIAASRAGKCMLYRRDERKPERTDRDDRSSWDHRTA